MKSAEHDEVGKVRREEARLTVRVPRPLMVPRLINLGHAGIEIRFKSRNFSHITFDTVAP